jgi:pyruvate/2-oxoglutarate dehydrogenase complex dihydrolipoamide dehydrogenase (E3) component
MEDYDLVVIGGGTAGQVAARIARRRFRRVALIEREQIGGDCLWYGCVPTKSLLASARVAHEARDGASFGLAIGTVEVDFGAVMARKSRIVARIAHWELPKTFRRMGIEVLLGPARFQAPHRLSVGAQLIQSARFVIATGSRPSIPPIPGLEEAGYLTNIQAVGLDHLPASLAVLGAGPIGCEFAQLFRRFGVRVVLVDAADHVLPREDTELSQLLAASLAAEGIDVRLGRTVLAVGRTMTGRRITLARHDGTREEVEASEILVATGRRPNTDLGLAAAGVEYSVDGIRVNRALQTSARRVWAAGDVVGPYRYTHVAALHGSIAGTNAAGGHKRVSYRAVPWATFTDPEVARAGLTEAEARQRYGNRVTVVRWPLASVDRALCEGVPQGLIKLVLIPGLWYGIGGGELVGAHIIGRQAGEWLHQLLLVMRARLPAALAAWPVHIYPTFALGVQQNLAQLFGYPGPPSGVVLPATEGAAAVEQPITPVER